jgi:hypothetical protein
MLDARRARAWRGLRFAATALIVEDHLPTFGKRGEGRPEEVVSVDHPAIDGEDGDGARDGRGHAHGEFEPARADSVPR